MTSSTLIDFLPWATVYYRIHDTNGPVEVKHPLPTNVLDDKFLGRIDITRIAPLTNGQNIKLAIAQYEGFQETFDVSGASLYNGSWLVPDPWVLSPVTGFGLQNPIVVVFPVKLTRSQASGSSADGLESRMSSDSLIEAY